MTAANRLFALNEYSLRSEGNLFDSDARLRQLAERDINASCAIPKLKGVAQVGTRIPQMFGDGHRSNIMLGLELISTLHNG
jgi:hypothetical protein